MRSWRDGGATWHGVEDVPADWPGCALTMGVFDGFHRGHVELVRRARTHATARRVPSALVTFDPHPLTVTAPHRAPRLLFRLEERVRMAHRLGIDVVCVLPFSHALAQLPAERFVEDVLVRQLKAQAVVVGSNFQFGHRGRGDATLLAGAGARQGFAVDAVRLVEHAGQPCSSTRVRDSMTRGDAATAEQVLGRKVMPRYTLAEVLPARN